MLTVMCPNCRHSFYSPTLVGGGCCPGGCLPATTTTTTTTKVSFDHNLPTSASGGVVHINTSSTNNMHRQEVTISTKYDTGSGGCMLQNRSNTEVLLQQQRQHYQDQNSTMPKLEIISKMSGGGCVVQNETSFEQLTLDEPLLNDKQLKHRLERAAEYQRGSSTTTRLDSPPSGCQELPGKRRESSLSSCRCSLGCTSFCKGGYSGFVPMPTMPPMPSLQNLQNSSLLNQYNRSQFQPDFSRSLADILRGSTSRSPSNNRSEQQPASNGSGIVNSSVTKKRDVEFEVNAKVRLPSSKASVVRSCTFSFTASTSTDPSEEEEEDEEEEEEETLNATIESSANMISFNGGGIVGFDTDGFSDFEPRIISPIPVEEPPITPISWLSFAEVPDRPMDIGTLSDKDLAKIAEVKSRLQMAGWYHEGLSWEHGQELLKDAPVGTWFMRNSSDESNSNSRYAFSVSVKTSRGPTSIRVLCIDGRFRMDAVPALVERMPIFDCPFEMMEHYREYSKNLVDIPEFWVDFNGTSFVKVNLAEPLLKQVRSLQHLARIAINRNRNALEQRIDKLAPSHKAFLAEYPHPL